MKRILILLAILAFFEQLYAQHDLQWVRTNNRSDGLGNNGAIITLNSDNISADFGRREFGGNKWHDGLDVTGDNDHGYKIRSIERENLPLVGVVTDL